MKYTGTLIAVKDMEKSKQFYHDVLGMEVAADWTVKPATPELQRLQMTTLCGRKSPPGGRNSTGNNHAGHDQLHRMSHRRSKNAVL